MSELNNIEWSPPHSPVGSVIWLHGLGADGNDFLPIASALQLPLRFVFPSASVRPITINNGYKMRGWYDITGMNLEDRADRKGMTDSIESINKLIESEIKRGISPEKIVLAGFSQGAVIALLTGLLSHHRLGGIIALSGCFPDANHFLALANSNNRTLPIFIAHGIEDPILPYEWGLMTDTLLKKHGYPTEWHSYSMPHSVCPQEIKDIRNWLAKIVTNPCGS